MLKFLAIFEISLAAFLPSLTEANAESIAGIFTDTVTKEFQICSHYYSNSHGTYEVGNGVMPSLLIPFSEWNASKKKKKKKKKNCKSLSVRRVLECHTAAGKNSNTIFEERKENCTSLS